MKPVLSVASPLEIEGEVQFCCQTAVVKRTRGVYGNTICEEESQTSSEAFDDIVQQCSSEESLMFPTEWASSFQGVTSNCVYFPPNESFPMNTNKYVEPTVQYYLIQCSSYLYQYVDQCQRSRCPDRCCCSYKTPDRQSEECSCHERSHIQDYLLSGFGDRCTGRKEKTF